MPTLYTHYYFGKEVLNNLNIKLQKNINKEIKYYDMFNQGFDNLYYYHKNWSYYKNLGINAHKKNIPSFFNNIITYIIDNNEQNNYILTNMLYGFINHYILDTILHPFINSQVKYLNIPHAKIEYMLDIYLYKQNYSKWNNKLYKELIPHLKFDNNLINLIDYTFLNTYQINNIGKIFNISHNNGYFIYRYFITDKHGIKTKLYKFIDKLIPKKKIMLSNYAFNTKLFNKDILNLEKMSWNNPKNKKEEYNYSLLELYDISLKLAIKFNNLAFEILNGTKNIKSFTKLIEKVEIKNIQQLL